MSTTPYNVPFTDPSKTSIVIQPGTRDTSTTLTLHGQGAIGLGAQQQTNFVYLLENFAYTSSPSNAIEGQSWFNSNDKSLSVCEFYGKDTIALINQGTKTITFNGSSVDAFSLVAGMKLVISSSTGNDGSYTVVSATFISGQTTVVVEETIPDPTADGIVEVHEWSFSRLYKNKTSIIAEADRILFNVADDERVVLDDEGFALRLNGDDQFIVTPDTITLTKVGTLNSPTLKVVNPLGTNSYGVVAELEISDTSASPIDRPSLVFTSRADATTKTWSVGYHSGTAYNIAYSTGFRIAEDHSTSGWGKDRLFIEPDGTNTLNLYNNGIRLSATTETEMHLQIGEGRTTDGYAYIDLIGDNTFTDYGLRIIRDNTGPDANSSLSHRGQGVLALGASDKDSSIVIGYDLSRVAIYKDLDVMGFNLTLGSDDQITRGDSGLSRALVKESGSSLVINLAGDFTGGVEVQSELRTTGDTIVGNSSLSHCRISNSGTIELTNVVGAALIDFKDNPAEDYDVRLIRNAQNGLDFVSQFSSGIFNFVTNGGSSEVKISIRESSSNVGDATLRITEDAPTVSSNYRLLDGYLNGDEKFRIDHQGNYFADGSINVQGAIEGASLNISNVWGSVQLTGFVNVYDGIVDWTAPAGSVMVGVYSEHSNVEEDRIFRYRYRALNLGGTP